jgi:hypothetical protein
MSYRVRISREDPGWAEGWLPPDATPEQIAAVAAAAAWQMPLKISTEDAGCVCVYQQLEAQLIERGMRPGDWAYAHGDVRQLS